jgi:hypothetical protein
MTEIIDSMSNKITIAFIALMIAASLYAQKSVDPYIEKANNAVPHKFKEIKTGATLEVIRDQHAVKIYMLIDDIEQYDEVLVERGDELQKNYSQCKVIQIEKGKYKNNYVELIDQYPLSPKMSNVYRVKTVTSEGITRMYPPVSIASLPEENAKK